MSAIPWSDWCAACRRAAGEAGGWTHWGATTQDIMDTATVLQVRDGLALIEAELLAILTALAAQADKHRDTVMAGRTHLQQALPVTFGLKCAIWAHAVHRASGAAGPASPARRGGGVRRRGRHARLARGRRASR